MREVVWGQASIGELVIGVMMHTTMRYKPRNTFCLL